VLLAAVAGARAAYPRYASVAPAPPAARAGAPGTPTPSPAAAPAPGDRVIVEFSDYECPFCARAHEQLALLRAARPDLEIVRRHFPLDAACNPALKRSIHPSACSLARAAICAEARGRFEQMDDALFKNQQDKAPVATLAARLGLDLPAFEACLVSPATEARLSRDVADAMRAGVRATPSYVVGGKVYAGELPRELWSAPPAAQPRARAAER
ncbi:DsbA family protein, partial [Anaeromyxobacter sp. SG17]